MLNTLPSIYIRGGGGVSRLIIGRNEFLGGVGPEHIEPKVALKLRASFSYDTPVLPPGVLKASVGHSLAENLMFVNGDLGFGVQGERILIVA